MKTGIKIRQQRLNKGYSQEYMASQIGISIKTYRNIEDGISKIYLKRLAIISHILETEMLDLIKNDTRYSFYKNTNYSTNENGLKKISSKKEIELYENLVNTKDALIRHLEIRIHDLTKTSKKKPEAKLTSDFII